MNTAIKETQPFHLDCEWVGWLEENLGLGVPAPAIVDAMVGRGCSREIAKTLVEAFSFRAGPGKERGSVRLAKARWLLESLRSLQAGDGVMRVAERTALDAGEFFGAFYARNLPVVFRNALSPADLACQLAWEGLERELGALEVEVQEGRSARRDYERESGQLKSRARFGDFLRRLRDAGESNDFYMMANNSAANAALIEAAFRPDAICPELLDGRKAHGQVFLWIGPQGTFTPAHHALTNNLFLQVHGSKSFRLASSLALLELDNDRHCYLASSLTETDERRKADGLLPLSFTVTLEAGDLLFLPLGWWHEVSGLSPSISLSATNFRARTDFHRSYSYFGPISG